MLFGTPFSMISEKNITNPATVKSESTKDNSKKEGAKRKLPMKIFKNNGVNMKIVRMRGARSILHPTQGVHIKMYRPSIKEEFLKSTSKKGMSSKKKY